MCAEPTPRAELEPFLATLAARDYLSDEEIATLQAASWHFRVFPAGAEIIADHSKPHQSCLLVGGLAARGMTLRNGERQLSAVHILGDFVDLHGLLLRVMDHAVLALTPCRAAFIDHAVLREITNTHPHLGRLLFTLVAIDASIQRNWILSLGRRKAEARLAHLFCELFARLEIVGGVSGDSFAFPISQNTLADILGLSIVHTNRTIQHLRASGLLTWRSGTVTILDHEGLAELAEFDSTYLNLFREER